MVDRLHGEVEGHKLDDRLQAAHRRACAYAGKTILGDRGVDDAAIAELFQQALRHLVGALILRHFLAHHEDAVVGAHLLGHGVAQRLAHRGLHDLGAGGNIGIGNRRAGRRRRNRLRGRLRRLGRGCLDLGSGGGGLDRHGAFTLASDQRDHRAHFHAVGAFRNDDLGDDALVHCLEFHRRLVGLDLREDVAGFHRIAFLDEPLCERTLLHGGRKRRHLQFNRHQYCPTSTSV